MNHQRRSIRLKEYDYSRAGPYYLTICIQNRFGLLGDISKADVELNDAGQMICDQWLELPKRFPDITIDEFVVMPNHFHGIIILNGRDESCIHPNNESKKMGEHKRFAPTKFVPKAPKMGQWDE